VVARCGCASQQNVSLFHNLQLRFSSRLPSSIDSAHFEKTASEASERRPTLHTGRSTYPSTFRKDSPHSSGPPCASWLRPQSGRAQLNAKASRRPRADSVRRAGKRPRYCAASRWLGDKRGRSTVVEVDIHAFVGGVLVIVALCAGRVEQQPESCGLRPPSVEERDQAGRDTRVARICGKTKSKVQRGGLGISLFTWACRLL
jgi:hypothetical protein